MIPIPVSGVAAFGIEGVVRKRRKALCDNERRQRQLDRGRLAFEAGSRALDALSEPSAPPERGDEQERA